MFFLTVSYGELFFFVLRLFIPVMFVLDAFLLSRIIDDFNKSLVFNLHKSDFDESGIKNPK